MHRDCLHAGRAAGLHVAQIVSDVDAVDRIDADAVIGHPEALLQWLDLA